MISPVWNVYVYDLVVQPVPMGTLMRSGLARGVSVRPIKQGDPILSSFPVPPAVVAQRFDQGAACLAAFRDDELQGYIWLLLGPYMEDEVRCTYVPTNFKEAAFDFDLYVFPEYRMSRAFASLWDGANQYLRERGKRWTYSRISRFNLSSRNAHARLGARRIAQALFLKLGRLELMLATVRPYMWLVIGNSVQPCLRLNQPD